MNLFDLFARITLDDEDYKKKLGENEGRTSAFADTLKSGLATAGKAAAAGLAAASTAAVALGKAALSSYADYEQLVGGVETLFGTGGKSLEEYAASVGKSVGEVMGEYNKMAAAENAVLANADKAYKAAGLSANEYMETVTSFSAALISSLGGDTVAAAAYADQAIIDMADNANKMGSSMESIQNAYQGFAKQNYSMLDNLKLGYGGTAQEMYRLLSRAAELDETFAKTANFSIDSKGHLEAEFADITQAIHIVQTEMGIAGATAAEAEGTISGSVAAMKSAWQNLITGIADPAQDFGGLINKFVDSVKIAGDNIIPRVKVITDGIGDLVTQMAPIIASALPDMVTAVLPPLLEAGGQLLGGLVSGIVSALPALAEAAVVAVGSLGSVLAEQGPVLMESAKTLIDMLYSGFLDAVPALLPVGVQIVTDLANKATDPDTLSNIVDAAITMITTLTEAIIAAIPQLLEAAPMIIGNLAIALVQNFPKIGKAAVQLVDTLFNGIIDNAGRIWDTAGEIIGNLVGAFGDLLPDVISIGFQIVEGIWTGIKNMKEAFRKNIKEFFTGIVDGVKNILGIHSPSRVFAEIGGNMASGLSEGWDKQYRKVKGDIEGGLHFGTASVDFADSGFNRAAQSAAIGLAEGRQGASALEGATFVVDLVLDGATLARKTYKFNQREGSLRGGSLVEVGV